MDWSDKIRFIPWVGNDYHQGFIKDNSGSGKRIKLLIVGESHYKDGSHDDGGNKTFTQDVVKNYLTPKRQRGWRPSKFWTVLGRTIAGRENYNPTKFWSKIAFYNFVQDFAGDGPRQRPSDQAWADSYICFNDVLDKLAPEKIIFLGVKLWGHVQKVVPTINEEGTSSTFFHIPHPSSYGFRSDNYHPLVSNFLASPA